jgi:phospholipid/cholesterol/gamma-HCH transport system permease protein
MNRLIRRGILRPLARIGRTGEAVALHAGQLAGLTWGVAVATLRGRVSLRSIIDQFWAMGVQSLPLVLVTAVISGVVTTQQGGYQLTSTIPLYVLGSVVASSVVLELGPVMTSFVLIGRVGARITAEIGTMQVSEQIDALHSLGRDPVAVLAAPRVIAGTITTPLLVSIANVVGIFSGMFAARLSLGLGYESFLYGARMYWHSWDLLYSINKGVVFGFIIPLISVHMGLRTRGGAEGVGRSTTAAVVFMIISLLVLDATFPSLFLN